MYESTETTYYAPTPEDKAREWIGRAMLVQLGGSSVLPGLIDDALPKLFEVASVIFDIPIATLIGQPKEA